VCVYILPPPITATDRSCRFGFCPWSVTPLTRFVSFLAKNMCTRPAWVGKDWHSKKRWPSSTTPSHPPVVTAAFTASRHNRGWVKLGVVRITCRQGKDMVVIKDKDIKLVIVVNGDRF
jgi:hypothetical protein